MGLGEKIADNKIAVITGLGVTAVALAITKYKSLQTECTRTINKNKQWSKLKKFNKINLISKLELKN